jgi:hypothetical protein
MSALRSRAIAIFENNYHYTVLKKCIRTDPETGDLIDKNLILSIMNSLKIYFRFSNVEDFHQMMDREN